MLYLYNKLLKNAILRIGEVSGIEGRKVFIKVDKNKNSSDILFDGNVIKNIAVGSYVEIKKGFLSIIGKVDSEKLTEEVVFNKNKWTNHQYNWNNPKIKRFSPLKSRKRKNVQMK